MSTYSRIPENYDLRKIVEALIKELEEQRVIDSSRTRTTIIEKGNGIIKEITILIAKYIDIHFNC